MNKIEQLKKIIKESNYIVFLGGAGVSTESGIPDFRSGNGLYKNDKYSVPPETILSHTYFVDHTEKFYDYYRQNMLYPEALPNDAHKALVKMEKEGKLQAIITQNIDGLHQKAGSRKVIELHGSVLRNYCMKCNKTFTEEEIIHSKGVPKCSCGGIVKPDVVLYEESLDSKAINDSLYALERADTLIVGGTSLTVNPAASLVWYFRGKHFVIINMSETPYDQSATLIIREPIGKVLKEATE